MTLPITDTFLLRVYDFIEELDKAYDFFAPRTMKEALCPEYLKLKREYARMKARKQFEQFLYTLKRHGYIKIKNVQQNKGILLTPKGAQRVFRLKLKTHTKQRRIDGKWEMIIFDIPERKRILRTLLREALLFLGYQKLQNSVWVCSYDVEKETENIIRRYALDPYVKVFLIGELER